MKHDAAFFDRLYRENRDPWDYETSGYEAAKYRRSLSLLSRQHHAEALEVGCSIGVMSEHIARRCDRVLGLDFAPTAVDAARRRGIPNARFAVAQVPDDWPGGRWDLIALSEVLYYLDDDALDRTIQRVAESLQSNGECLVVGYTGRTDTRLTARTVESRLMAGLSVAYPDHSITRCSHPSWTAAAFTRQGSSDAEGYR